MKYFFSIITFLFVLQTSNAQMFKKEKIIYDANQGRGTTDNNLLRWGYFFGVNDFDFNFDYKENIRNGVEMTDINVQRTNGFNVGLIGNLRINEFLDLRLEPGLVVTNRNLLYSETDFLPNEATEIDVLRELKSTYIYVPLLLKISTKRVNNFKPFIVGGISTALNLSSYEDSREDNSDRQFRTTKNNLFYELGFGIDFYTHNFKFTPSIRGLFGINDELVRDVDPNSPWTGNIEKMTSRGVFLNFTFQ